MSNNDPKELLDESKISLDKAVFHLIETIRSYEDDNVTEEEATGLVVDLIDNLRISINFESGSLLGRCIKRYRERQL